MFVREYSKQKWSRFALYATVATFGFAIFFSIADALVYGEQANSFSSLGMWRTLFYNFRVLATEMIYGFIILFAAAKFFETRTIFTIGFDNLDAAKISMKGPDENNIVWIGQRYGSKYEADVIAAALEERLKESVG